jgi:hypothetical protein
LTGQINQIYLPENSRLLILQYLQVFVVVYQTKNLTIADFLFLGFLFFRTEGLANTGTDVTKDNPARELRAKDFNNIFLSSYC